MKRIRTRSLRLSRRRLMIKFFSLSAFFISLVVIMSVSNINKMGIFQTDILKSQVITSAEIEKKAKKLNFDGIVRPVMEVTDLSQTEIEYSKLRYMQWKDISGSTKTVFPVTISDIIEEYKYVTLQDVWTNIDDPVERKKINLYRRLVRATWTASYEEKNIWIPDTGTHAGIDIMANVGTPTYAIANGVVVQIEYSNAGFGNFVGILHKINGDYYVSYYAHMDSFASRLDVGDVVDSGDLIAYIGNTGNSTGPHLHLQINKVDNLQDVVDGSVFNGWYHNLGGVKEYTVNPISFIEKYQDKKSIDNEDNEEIIEDEDVIDDEDVEEDTTKPEDDEDDLLDELLAKIDESGEDDEDAHASAPEAVLKSTELSLIEDKVKKNNSFTLTLEVEPGEGNITINTSNSNLEYSKFLIEDPEDEEYKITFVAVEEGNCSITVSDGDNKEKHSITIYEEITNDIYGISLEGNDEIYMSTDTEYVVYPIDKYGNRLEKEIDEDFKIYLKNTHTDKKDYITEIEGGEEEFTFTIQGLGVGDYKIIVESDTYYATKMVVSKLFFDYGSDDTYSDSIEYLVRENIVRGEEGSLKPDRTINRRELITIIGRSVLEVDYDEAKQDMEEYIAESGKFFKDIDGKAYSDPYIYAAWKSEVTKGENGYFYPSRSISKGEILLIYTRTFNITTEVNKFTLWGDLKEGEGNYIELKPVADTVKRLNLFPNMNTEDFNSGEEVTRLVGFEVLKRFIDVSEGKEVTYNDDEEDNISEDEADFQSTLEEVFDF